MIRSSQQHSGDSKSGQNKVRIQFGLKALLVMMTIIGTGFGVHAWFASKVQTKRTLREKLIEVDAYYTLAHQSEENLRDESSGDGDKIAGITEDEAEYTQPGPEFLRRIYGQDAFFEFTHVELNSKWCSDELLESALQQPKLTSLSIAGCKLNEVHLKHLASSSLEDVDLELTEPEETLAALSNVKTLKSLYVSCNELSLKSIDAIGKMPSLEKLTVSPAKNISSAVLSRIGTCERLNWLWLDFADCQRDAFQISSIAELKHLEHLRIIGGAIVFDVPDVAFAKQLKSLWLTRVAFPNPTPGRLAPFESLEELLSTNCGFGGIGNRDFPTIGKLKKLEVLNLIAPIDGENLNELKGLSELRVLSILHGCSTYFAKDIEFIAFLNKLERVSINPCGAKVNDLNFLYHPKSLRDIFVGGNVDPLVTQSLAHQPWWPSRISRHHFRRSGSWIDLNTTDFGGLPKWSSYSNKQNVK